MPNLERSYCFDLLKFSHKSKRFTALVACVPLVQKASWTLRLLISVIRIPEQINSSRIIRSELNFHGSLTSVLHFY